MAGVIIITAVLKKGTATKADYQTFAQHYMHTMLTTMYLADAANTTAVLKQLKAWKQQLGSAVWNNVYVLIIGSKGRPTAEFTIDTNTAALTIRNLLPPAAAALHIFIMPDATSAEEAFDNLGQVLNGQHLAQTAFVTSASQQARGIYHALMIATIPLAKDSVTHIVHDDLTQGKVKIPYLGILAKDKSFINNPTGE